MSDPSRSSAVPQSYVESAESAESVELADPVEEEPSVDPIQIIVANNPLPESGYPSNAPRAEETHLSLVSTPKMLSTVEELKALMAESRAATGFSNFAEISLPNKSARTPVYPTFTRFSSTRFSNAELAEYKVVPTDRPETGALYDMVYPISLVVTDSRKMSLPDLPFDGIPDSRGYPVLYNSEEPVKILRARSSAALYPANLSRALANRMTTFPDAHTVRTWAHMFQLTNERDAQAILLQRVMGSVAGDNHIALLLKAYLSYFDSIVGALDGVVPSRRSLSSAGVVVNTSVQDGWTTQMLGSSAEMVNVLGGAPGYQEFWAYCCFDQPPVFAAKTSAEGVMATTVFSQYKMGYGMSMTCLCDLDAYSAHRQPGFFAKPNLILGYIESYVQKFGLQQQANEALQIAMLWPSLCQTQANVSLPKPYHSSDWFGGEVERPPVETSYQGLISSSPFVVLASTLASAWAMQSQIYDFVTLLAAKRTTWRMSKGTIRHCVAWLVENASAPGAGWDFLLRHQFGVTPSFLYLTGLASEIVDWNVLLAGFAWRESQFPAHLRLLQPFWVKTSICCLLPWEDTWFPQLEMSGRFMSANPATIMGMLRLGLLDGTPDISPEPPSAATSLLQSGVYPILDRDGKETVDVSRSSMLQLQAVLQHGIRVLALCARSRAYDPRDVLSSTDPADSRRARRVWSSGALSQH